MTEPKRLSSAADYAAHMAETEVLRLFKANARQTLLNNWATTKTLPGFSYPIVRMVDFLIDPNLRLSDGSFNLRETVNCPETWFNTRMRAVIHAIELYEKNLTADVYISEQKTPLYRHFKARYDHLIGSEYLGDAIPLGRRDAQGLRNEDATRLTFQSESFDLVLSFEVLEHIPDYMAALREARRILRRDGRFYFTAPFNPGAHDHLIRAKVENGQIVHVMEPEWHGDPVTGEGILCFQHFGWAVLDELRTCGFASVEVLAFDQIEYGYYTQDPILVIRAVA